ncbi:quercetin dioxygenase-like cupin family protein [Variovorax boronicumulans]|uniref:cupin domain-containing protein n=1 Tax=Variovorax boronicumulans TaxID=436515 RepID=UPI00277EA88E|nr:cupin domain-containing protein [Variovorax boronicumulans]MDP9995733.1 quercetin dioxygenase-like cupin family protein [Variovorax boronicumulans]MDQ0006802.1 quercetin dioxygenase-like cupin family protein [Variovorax boronicumulans]MDQ0036749.1 quercetin dioxygenase-like cupin family protein [Variovorax boronicumulans]MDQ0044571.1 quercetin dioxygenase-like cupin family protein [Variovorax boronicumulans]
MDKARHTNPARVYKLDEMALEQVRSGFSRTGLRAQNCITTVNWFEPGYKSTGRHSHPFDQLSYVLTGTLRFWVDDEVFDMVAPSMLYIPPNATHGAEPLGDERVLNVDVFSPVREDYLPLCAHQHFVEHHVAPSNSADAQ